MKVERQTRQEEVAAVVVGYAEQLNDSNHKRLGLKRTLELVRVYHIVQCLFCTNEVTEDKRERVAYPSLYGNEANWQPKQDRGGPWPSDFQPSDFSTQQCQDQAQLPAC